MSSNRTQNPLSLVLCPPAQQFECYDTKLRLYLLVLSLVLPVCCTCLKKAPDTSRSCASFCGLLRRGPRSFACAAVHDNLAGQRQRTPHTNYTATRARRSLSQLALISLADSCRCRQARRSCSRVPACPLTAGRSQSRNNFLLHVLRLTETPCLSRQVRHRKRIRRETW